MSQIVTLHQQHVMEIKRFLLKDELWNMIALDALQTYGINHPFHEWYAELDQGRIRGVIFRNQAMVQFAYPKVPPRTSALYEWFNGSMPTSFITHGKNEVVGQILKRFNGTIKRVERARLFRQSAESVKAIKAVSKHVERKLDRVKHELSVSKATYAEVRALVELLQRSEVNHLTDPKWIEELVRFHRVYVARLPQASVQWPTSQVIGTIMELKKSPSYVMLGGLYVHPTYRSQGIAKWLCYQALMDIIKRKKRACFYYSNQTLTHFYAQARFVSVGEWGSYIFTSNETI